MEKLDRATSVHELPRQLAEYLSKISKTPDPNTGTMDPADSKMFEWLEFYVPKWSEEEFSPSARMEFIVGIYSLIPVSPNGLPEQVIKLLGLLVKTVPISKILDLDPPVDFGAGLDLHQTEYQWLTLTLLASANHDSAQRLATSNRSVFENLIKLWLCTPRTSLADKAANAILHLLRVGGQLVWRRLIRDKDVYEQIFAICSLESGKPPHFNKKSKTLAQARLLGWLPQVADLNWDAILESHHPEVEASYGLKPGEGLLDFAAVRMIDYNDDVLMARTLISFYADLLGKYSTPRLSNHSPMLKFFISRGIHARTLKIYTHPEDSADESILVSILYPEAARYTATFAATHPLDLLDDKPTQNDVLSRLKLALSISTSQWAMPSTSPTADLHVLASLPPASLLLDSSVLNLLSSRSPNADLLNTLATIFHGPIKDENVWPPREQSPDEIRENNITNTHSRKVYSGYLSAHPSLYTDVVAHANRPALHEVALAALILLKAIVTAPWGGALEIMSTGAHYIVVPYLVGIPPRPPAGTGSVGKDLQQIAEAHHGLARALADALAKEGSWKDVEAMLRSRVYAGVWGRIIPLVPTVAVVGSS
jgi:hypothetical protein